MSFEKNTAYEERIALKNGGNATVFEFPLGNYFGAMDLDLNLDLDIATGAPVGIISHQVARMIEKLEIFRDGENQIWNIAGEDLARLFRYRDGVEAVDNAQIAAATGNGVTGRMFLHIPFYLLGSPKQRDCAMDTVNHKYKMKIKFRDVMAANTLFKDLATNSSAITVNDSGSYIDLTLHKLALKPGPNGQPDAYDKVAPYFPGLISQTTTIDSTQSDKEIKLPESKVIYGAVLFANADSDSGVNPTGYNTILTDNVVLKNTQGRVINNIKVATLRQLTSLKHRNASLEDGLYDFDFTEYGNIPDSLYSDNVAPLKFVMPVAKLTNETRIMTIVKTVERQGSGVGA